MLNNCTVNKIIRNSVGVIYNKLPQQNTIKLIHQLNWGNILKIYGKN